jgi:uncharacterized membrane protein YphA (DoxX/SURF4 family)
MPSPFRTKPRSWVLALCVVGAGIAAAWVINRFLTADHARLFSPQHILLILLIVLLVFAGGVLRGE